MDFQTPEDLLRNRGGEVLKQMRKSAGPIVIGVLLLGTAATSFYSIGPDEVGVVLRFGRYVKQTDPGLHLKLPFFIETVIPVKVRRIFKEEFGFRAGTVARRGGRELLQNESLMLTGDLNVIEVEWIVQFQVSDPVQFLFNVRDQQEVIRDISEAVMREIIGDYSVDEALTTKRAEIDVAAQTALQTILDSYELGVQIVTVKLQDVTPPDRVKPAFNEVNEAKQEKERVINQAWEAYNRVVPRAKGEAEKTIREAEGYAMNVVNRAKGEGKRFLATWTAYRQAPEVTRKRLYLDALEDVLSVTKRKIIIDPSQKTLLPLLQLQAGGGS